MDGYQSELSFIGEHEQIPDMDERIANATDFWDVLLMSISWGDIPDAYPFNWEGSTELKGNDKE